MTTKLTDIIIPEIFQEYLMNEMLEKSIFFNSGIAVPNDELNAFLNGGGQTINLPFMNQLSNDEANISSDDNTSDATPKKLTAGKNIAVRHSVNQAWSSMDLTAALAGVDPLSQVVMSVAKYWDNRLMARLVSSLEGVKADNVANDSGDMVYDITTAGTVTDANRFSAEALIQTMLTMGDSLEDLAALAVHSVVFARMTSLDLIDTMKDSEGRFVQTYLGRPIFVSDQVPASGSPTKYTTIVFAAGAVGYGAGLPKVPTEVERNALAGDGGGEEIIVDRKEFVIHPNGFQFDVSGIAKTSPSIAELEAAAQWDRQFERKRVKVAYLITNG